MTGDTISSAELARLRHQGVRKYRNVPSDYNGVRYDSKKEASIAQELDLSLRAGAIVSWQRRIRFPCDVNGHHICDWIADFVVKYPDGHTEVWDVKSPITRREKSYRIKCKLIHALHGIDIREV